MIQGLSEFLPEIFLSRYDNIEFMIRVLIAAVLGGSIGYERHLRDKGVGIRTHTIIAVTSAVFMILSKYAFVDLVDFAGTKGADPARIAAQVVSGISFLGAGIIFKQGRASVKGLTTAAGMWATASIGMTIGAGLYWLSLFVTGLLIFIQWFFHKYNFGNQLSEQEIEIKMKDDPELIDSFYSFLNERKHHIEESRIHRSPDEGSVHIRLNVRIDPPIECEEVMEFMRKHPEVSLFSA